MRPLESPFFFGAQAVWHGDFLDELVAAEDAQPDAVEAFAGFTAACFGCDDVSGERHFDCCDCFGAQGGFVQGGVLIDGGFIGLLFQNQFILRHAHVIHGGEEPIFRAKFVNRLRRTIGDRQRVTPVFLGNGYPVFDGLACGEFDVLGFFGGLKIAAVQFQFDGVGLEWLSGLSSRHGLSQRQEFVLVCLDQGIDGQAENLAVITLNFHLSRVLFNGEHLCCEGAALFIGQCYLFRREATRIGESQN